MEAHEHEPSYYEVALTNRQVVTGFVILLACLFTAFLAGVWLGRGDGEGGRGAPSAAASRAPEAGEAKLEQLTFFGARGAAPAPAPPAAAEPQPSAAAPSRPPARVAPTPAELEAEKLRQTLEAEMARHRADLTADGRDAAPAEEAAPAASAGARLRRQPANGASAPTAAPAPPVAAVAAPAVAAPPAAGAVWIQVYSSANGVKARELAARLRRSAFQVAVLEAAGAGGATYRVRVGPYATRDEADRAASRLRRDHRLDTWVTEQP